MRLDIPQEQPRRRDGNDAAPGSSDGRAVTRKPPDNPILHRLKSLEQRTADHREPRPQAERKRVEQPRDVPRERRRPVASADPRRPARTAGNVVGLELRPEEKQLLREAGRFRVVRTADLRETLYNGKSRPLENDLRSISAIRGWSKRSTSICAATGSGARLSASRSSRSPKTAAACSSSRATSPKTRRSTPVWSSRARPNTTRRFTGPTEKRPNVSSTTAAAICACASTSRSRPTCRRPSMPRARPTRSATWQRSNRKWPSASSCRSSMERFRFPTRASTTTSRAKQGRTARTRDRAPAMRTSKF